MAFEFKKLSDVNKIETMTDSASVLVEDGGEIVRVPKSEIGGGVASWNDLQDKPFSYECTKQIEIDEHGTTKIEVPAGDRFYIYPLPSEANSALWYANQIGIFNLTTDEYTYLDAKNERESEWEFVHCYGNMALKHSSYTDTGEDYFVYAYDGGFSVYARESCTLNIEAYVPTIPLAEHFIPNTIARTSQIPEVSQPDWNANEGEPGYVMNRTHYEEYITKHSNFNDPYETNSSPVDPYTFSGTKFFYDDFFNAFPPNGSMVTIVFDGITYEFDSYKNYEGPGYGVFYHVYGDAAIICGNGGTLCGTEVMSSGEPFALYRFADGGTAYYKLQANDENEHTIQVSWKKALGIKTIDEKFIPDTIARKSDVGGNVLIVTLIGEDYKYTPDKTLSEIRAAVESGIACFMLSKDKEDVMDMYGSVVPLSYLDEEKAVFNGIYIGSDPYSPNAYVMSGIVNADGTGSWMYNAFSGISTPT